MYNFPNAYANESVALGFTQSTTLENKGSENAGLRDQRLAIRWVRGNIEQFDDDPEKITIHG